MNFKILALILVFISCGKEPEVKVEEEDVTEFYSLYRSYCYNVGGDNPLVFEKVEKNIIVCVPPPVKIWAEKGFGNYAEKDLVEEQNP